MTTFATIGMSTRPQPGTRSRVELHLAVRGKVTERIEAELATFLANLSEYPWDHGHVLDWWHTLSNVGQLPAFTRCEALLLHPRFVEKGWDVIEHGRQEIRILNVVPITRNELTVTRVDRAALLGAWHKERVDIFSDRKLKPKKRSTKSKKKAAAKKK